MIIAKLAASASFWGFDWLELLEHKDWRQENVALAVFVGMLSPWASTYVIQAFFETFKGDSKSLEKYLPVLVLGYLKQQTRSDALECPEMETEVEKAIETLDYFVSKFCEPYVQERYAALRTKSAKRAKLD